MDRSTSLEAEREELIQLLRRESVLHATDEQPILSRDGTTAKWMLDSLCTSLSPRGAELAGDCLVELLNRYDGCQLATYGTTGIPLMQAAIMRGGDRYRGLLVRKARKPHGSRKLIEGVIDPDEPVILVDDSVSSGISMREGTAILEEAGLRVEGGICLVRFGWYGGFALMQERGYHMEAVYDIWEDFIYHMEGEPPRLTNPSRPPIEIPWAEARAPEGMEPWRLARLVMESYLREGRVPRPPARLDRDYAGDGGAWVSVRDRNNIHLRHAREGYWVFPGEAPGELAEGLIYAALRSALKLAPGDEGLEHLEQSAVAVTFFDALEEVRPGALDNDRYGIVVRSTERPGWIGGALPRMPGIRDAFQQYRHARKNNARLASIEPDRIWRHDVSKVIEPGVDWQASGVPKPTEPSWYERANGAGAVAQVARDLLLSILRGEEPDAALEPGAIPEGLESVFVSIYASGQLIGCMGATLQEAEADLEAVVRAALGDKRFASKHKDLDPDSLSVSVSFLHSSMTLGRYSPTEVMKRVRLGQQALLVWQGNRSGLLLPSVATSYSLNAEAFAAEVIDKAGITRPPYRWQRFECASWLVTNKALQQLDGAFPRPDAPPALAQQLPSLAELMLSYVKAQRREDGVYPSWYRPCFDHGWGELDPVRRAHLAWVLARAARILHRAELFDLALEGIAALFERAEEDAEGRIWFSGVQRPSVAETSFLLLAYCEFPAEAEPEDAAPRLAETLWSLIDRHGRLQTHPTVDAKDELFQDYCPGQALLALARAAERGLAPRDDARLKRAFRYYRHRFDHRRDWGQVSWLAQAWSTWHRCTGDAEFSDHLYKIVDWALEHQSQRHGGFINDHQPDPPGYSSALYLEAVSAALRTASASGDGERRKRYLEASERGFGFLDSLVLQERDMPLLPAPERALGGLREGIYRSDIRLDFVQHALSALLELWPEVVDES